MYVQQPTMTLNECANAMRDRGIPCSPRGIADAIERGEYPFGRVKHNGKKRRAFEIFRVDFEAWLDGKVGDKA